MMNTKSIDVGSMFLMDLSVNEADLFNGIDGDENLSSLDNDQVFPRQQQHKFTQSIDSYKQHKHNNKAHHTNHYHNYNYQHQGARHNNSDPQYHRHQEVSLLTNNSLERLTDVINGVHHSPADNSTILTNLDTHPDIVIDKVRGGGFIVGSGQDSTASSLSDDEQFVGSSTVTSSSSGTSSCNENDRAHDMHSLSSEASYNGSCSDYGINHHERASTTREDSGVLDMKDLVGSQKSEADCSSNEEKRHSQHINFTNIHDNKQISNNIKATNLINNNNKTANNVYENSYLRTTTKPATNPTNFNNNNSNHHHHHQHNSNHGSKRSVSASLPIEVPTRQMKKNLNKLKLNIIGQKVATPVAGIENNKDDDTTATTSTGDCTRACDDYQNNGNSLGYDDFDEFLEQEYNENHHNHYPMKEHERFRADEDPMKLFESIQALARSLHEDTELFGSLPPKRMLESPIRSLALV